VEVFFCKNRKETKMDAKQLVKQGYDFFNTGNMEGFMNLLHDDCIWTFPGDSSPLSGTHKGKVAIMKTMSNIPSLWTNFTVTPEFMISEGNKVFVKVNAKADGADTIFGHYFEVEGDKLKSMITFDDTLSMSNAMIK
tara:strand:- start:43 stop:453 length:411 start_codon:yes stop_codon:yes gene_type:complete